MRSLLWFRNDLRTGDNRALDHAARNASSGGDGGRAGIVGVFLVADRQWAAHDWGPAKVDFVMRTVAALGDDLAALNIPLLIRRAASFDDAPATLLALARDHGCDRLVFNREYEVNELRRDAAVERAFHAAGLCVRSFHDQTILRPDSIATGSGKFYTVYTPYKKAWLTAARGSTERDPVASPRRQPPLDIASDAVPDRVPGFDASPVDASHWPAGEREARHRLGRFIERHAAAYHTQRDLPDAAATSTLSPYLAVGSIGPRTCLAAAIEANRGGIGSGRPGLVAWIEQLIWREFYRHILVGFPRVCMNRPFKHDTERIDWATGDVADDRFERWCAGRTGVPIVDAGMRQLAELGWMHNRLRMVTAMYLTKNLFLDWRRGEWHFMRSLVDGDLANNNGGWQWSASTGTDAAPYFRVFNPISQSERFDAKGHFIRRYVRELADADLDDHAIHDPHGRLPDLVRSTLDYPEPLVDLPSSRAAAIEAFKSLRR